MKKRLLFVPILIAPFALSGCSFDNIFTPRVAKIAISDETPHYAVGDVFYEYATLSITATYTNGRTKDFTIDEIDSASLYRMYGEEKVEQNYKTAFTTAGDYFFTVSMGGKTSNKLSFEVLAEHVYVSSISISGPTELLSKETGNYTLTITPSNYTTPISIASQNANAFTFTKTETGFDAFAMKAGSQRIIVTTKSSATTTITRYVDVEVTASAPLVSMEQNLSDYVKYNYHHMSSCPLTGNPKLLVIPVWFTNSSTFVKNRDKVKSDIQTTYFGTTSETGWNSVSSYYYKESQGTLNLTGTVSNWYECEYSYQTAGEENFDTKGLVKSAVNWYFNNNPSDSRSNYDTNNDKYLDGVMLIYAAPDCQQTGYEGYGNLWAYCFWIQEQASVSIIPNAFFWASYDFMYGSGTAITRAGTRFHNGDTSHSTLDGHTYIHEMGHVFGLEDYYDYSKQFTPAGSFSMQDYNVGGHDPYSLLSMGWADAYIPDDSVTITISEFTKSHDLILLSNNFNSYNSPFDEYLLLELYSPNDLNQFDTTYRYCNRYPLGPNRVGIRLWHVDARLATTNNGINYTLATPNAKAGRVKFAISNTYYNESEPDGDYKGYLSVMKSSTYYDYNMLQLIRNNTNTTYRPTGDIVASDLFTQGSSFSTAKHSKQFKNGTRFNNGTDINWSFTVDSITTSGGISQATITLTRAN